jgi:RNA polymerase sigma factor (sigma-70 family)
MADPRKPGGGYFPDTTETLWGTVIGAARGDEATRRERLEELFALYRGPILREIQARQRCSPEKAEDLCHDFIGQSLRLEFLRGVSPEHGRFRAFVKACIGNFLRDQHARETAEKRGGGRVPSSLDETTEDGRRLHDPPAELEHPGEVLDREWARSVIDRALERLQAECVSARSGTLFEALRGHLGRASDPGTSAAIGARLGISENHVNVALGRMRKRLREHIEDIIRQTVGADGDWRDELRALLGHAGHTSA